MVRRTKADAEVTRNSLLDAAELLFQARGVSRTSLNDIALAAGTTRGAVYWHFQDKADLFNAMMDRATLPLEEDLTSMGEQAQATDHPVLALRTLILEALHKIANEPRMRRVFEVVTLQVEYNEEMRAARDRRLQVRSECVASTVQAFEAASSKQAAPLPMPLEMAALGCHVLIDGLIHNWLMDPTAFDLQTCGAHTMDAYLRGLGFTLPDAPAPRPQAAKRSRAVAGAKQPAPSDLPKPVRSRKQTA